MLRIRYNAPAVLSFSLLASIVFLIDSFTPGELQLEYFSVGPGMNPASVIDWLRLFTHVLGHGSAEHLIGNLSFMLLLGPILEEKYGTPLLIVMIVCTSLATGIASIAFSSVILLGASGLVFMMILLSSFTNTKRNEIPLSFILVVIIYLFRELLAAFRDDSISQLAHIIGGAVGSMFGFVQSLRPRT